MNLNFVIFRASYMGALAFSFLLLTSHAGVLAHYSFDNDFQDSSGNGRHGSLIDTGTIGNSTIIQTAGNFKFGDGAMNFSSDRDYVSIPSMTFLNGEHYTIAFWAQKDVSGSKSMAIGQYNTTVNFITVEGEKTLWRGASSINTTAGTGTADTDWHHYVIVADGTNIKIYIDGELDTTNPQNTGFTVNSIGEAYSSALDLDFQGGIDEVWILDEAANASQISNLYESNIFVSGPVVTKVRVVLVGGQSNADGRAHTSGFSTSPVNLQNPQADIDFIYKVEGGSTTFTTLRPGLSEFGLSGPEVTLGRTTANLYVAEANTQVVILKYANGNTNLYNQWKGGGDATTTGDGTEYLIFQQTVNEGLALLASTYPSASIELEGMLWVQGEADTNASGASVYETNLTNFITDIRATFGAHLPFIISRLSINQTALNALYLNTVIIAQDKVASVDPLTSSLNTNSFALKNDNLHFSAAGQESLGTAAAKDIAYYRWVLDTFSQSDINTGLAEPDEDPDADGKTNKMEFLGNSAPKDATSQFRAWITLPTSTTAEIRYDSSASRRYAVEQYQIATNSWVEILPYELGNGAVSSRILTLVNYPQIFRVRSDLP